MLFIRTVLKCSLGVLGTTVFMSMGTLVIATESSPPGSKAKPDTATSETRFVKFEKASVHCGPAKDHYTTSILPRGATVEIYHQTKDGWCGIRPPQGSHDWLAADQAYLLPGGKQAEVVGNKTPAWIGAETILNDQRFRWQIELQPTQKVQVIGEVEQAVDSDKVRLWYKILPPPGEFRWIRAEALSAAPLKSRTTTVTLAGHQTAKSSVDESTQKANIQSSPRKNTAPSSVLVRQAVNNQIVPMIHEDSAVELNQSFQGGIMLDESAPHTTGVSVEREPVAGEYIAGEGIVVGSIPNHWNRGEEYIDEHGIVVGESIVDGETIIDGNMGDGNIVDGNIVDGNIVDGGLQPCASCSRIGCTTCGPNHQTDSFQQWDNVESIGNPKLRFRPLGRILGLIGISVVEGERVEGYPNSRCPAGCGCARCTQHASDLNPRSSGRFNHLPRPARRLPAYGSGDWLGMNDNASELLDQRDYLGDLSPRIRDGRIPSASGLDSLFQGSESRGLTSSIGQPSASRAWHGIAPARLGSNLGNADFAANSSKREQSLLASQNSSVVSASGQSEELHLSTPELQQAMLELTQVIAQSMDRWNLQEHAARAQRWIEQATDPIARGEARLLLERIESFELLRRRSENTNELAYATSPVNASSLNNSIPANLTGFQRPLNPAQSATPNEPFPVNPASLQRNADGTPASDASGWLVEVHSAEYGQPEYALTDDYGGLIAYVQPSPGMNLYRYLKQPVGIYGVKGYLPNLSARQIVAERIVRLR